MTFEWLPMINPYVWPFSVFHVVTSPYFAFWARILPSIKLDKSSNVFPLSTTIGHLFAIECQETEKEKFVTPIKILYVRSGRTTVSSGWYGRTGEKSTLSKLP